MKTYRIILAIVLVAIIAFGVWYCVSAYNEQRSTEKGILVEHNHFEKRYHYEIGACE